MSAGFYIPNEAQATTYIEQSSLDSVDFTILAAGVAGYGVISGCAVTAQVSADLTVAVSEGFIQAGAQQVHVPAQNTAAYAASGSNPRYALVEINPAANPGSRATRNTGAAATAPYFPTPTVGNVVLAALYIPTSATSITTAQIVDKRMFINNGFSVPGKLQASSRDWTRSRP